MAKKKVEDPRQKVRVYQDGLNLIEEFYIEPGVKVIDVDIYITQSKPDVVAHVNAPAKRVSKEN